MGNGCSKGSILVRKGSETWLGEIDRILGAQAISGIWESLLRWGVLLLHMGACRVEYLLPLLLLQLVNKLDERPGGFDRHIHAITVFSPISQLVFEKKPGWLGSRRKHESYVSVENECIS